MNKDLIDTEREAFENWQGEWYSECHFNRDESGEYTDSTIQSQWTAWLARAAITGAA